MKSIAIQKEGNTGQSDEEEPADEQEGVNDGTNTDTLSQVPTAGGDSHLQQRHGFNVMIDTKCRFNLRKVKPVSQSVNFAQSLLDSQVLLVRQAGTRVPIRPTAE